MTVANQPSSPVAAYGFDEGSGAIAADASGGMNTGDVSGASWTSAGKHGGALSFDGIDDWVTIADSPALDLTAAMTLEAWIRPTSLVGWSCVLMKEFDSDLAYSLYANDNNDQPGTWLASEFGTTNSSAPDQLRLDQWTHLAATFDDSTAKLYVNGTLEATETADNPLRTSSSPLRIGGDGPWGEWFEGTIDDVRIYDRALSAAEIVTDMGTPVTAGDCSGTLDDGNPCTDDACTSSGITHTPVATGTSCSDGNACNGAETCNASAVCTSGTPPTTDDANPCTSDACNASTGVTHTAVAAGTSCSDGNACNGAETCNASAACTSGTTPTTDDGNPCTTDACNPATGVTHTPVAAGTNCSDGNACNGTETCNASATCVAGTPPVTDDGNACTSDACNASTGVTHTPVASGTSCSDANACNGAESCNGSGLCVAGTPPSVDDGNVCTSDACDPALGVTHIPIATGTSCSDGDVCNGAEACNTAGICAPGTPLTVDDGNPCTTDSCNPTSGVSHAPVSAGTICSDGNACNGLEACNGSGGCMPGTPPTIDDSDPCTVDSCDGQGVHHAPAPVGTSCEPGGNVCNGGKTCNASGACVATDPAVVDDGNPCTDDSCDPNTGVHHAPRASGTVCGDHCFGFGTCSSSGSCEVTTSADFQVDDQDPCTDDYCDNNQERHPATAPGALCAGDYCDNPSICTADGECVPGTPDLDDGNPCTDDRCTSSGLVHSFKFSGVPCGHIGPTLCDGILACDGMGSCNMPRDVDDGNSCTVDSCDETGVHNDPLPVGSACGDGNPCFHPGICDESGFCNGEEPIDVSDANDCTVDTCQANGSITHEPTVGAFCNFAANPCVFGTCTASGSCEAGAPVDADDGNPCTADSCDPSTGLTNTPLRAGATCGEQSGCDAAPVCDGAGTCLPPVGAVIDDGNPCTVDSCNPDIGVVHVPIDAGTSCSDGNACNGVETCDGAGNCSAGTPLALDDGDPCTDDICNVQGQVAHVTSPPGKNCGQGLVCDGQGTCKPLPADPVTIAPPTRRSVATSIFDSTRFLYTGDDPIQTGVAEGTIRVERAAVIRGKVMTRDGEPLSGVAVSVRGRAEFGRTFSRADGSYDLAVNGGTVLVVDFTKPGYLPAQRSAQAPRQDFLELDAVALTTLDANVTTVGLPSTALTAVGGTTSDGNGSRTPTLMFSSGTNATMLLPDGTTQPLDAIHVRLTEYTVGPNGPNAMPGDLPKTSGYTYAIELSADEALAAGATSVQFDRSVAFYVDDYIGFPIGTAIPTGYYDFQRGAWVAQHDGLTVSILEVNSGTASLDIDGTGVPASSEKLGQLGVTLEERQQLAQRYSPGKVLWRVPVSHFSSLDMNHSIIDPDDADDPDDDDGPDEDNDPDDSDCEQTGSRLAVGAQGLGESVRIAGTPYSLTYASKLQRGYQPRNSFRIRLTGASLPASLERVELDATIGGVKDHLVFPPTPNQTYTIQWNGLDPYGRRFYGAPPTSFTITYVYPRYFTIPFGRVSLESPDLQSWALASGTTLTYFNRPVQFTDAFVHARRSKTWTSGLGSHTSGASTLDVTGIGLGGWLPDVMTIYDPNAKAVIEANGRVRKNTDSYGHGTRKLAGGGAACGAGCCNVSSSGVESPCADDGRLANEVDTGAISGIIAMPDSTILYAASLPGAVGTTNTTRAVLRRLGTDGRLTTFVSSNATPVGSNGSTGILDAGSLARGADGTVFFGRGGQIVRFQPTDSGVVAPTPVLGFGSADIVDGVQGAAVRPATHLNGLAATGDGTIYFAYDGIGTATASKVRRMGPDGIVHVIAGNPGGSLADDIPAVLAGLNQPFGLGVAEDGSVLFADHGIRKVRKVTPNGKIETVAGDGCQNCGDFGDGIPALSAHVNAGMVLPGVGDTFYVVGDGSVRFVDANGIIRTVAGRRPGDLTVQHSIGGAALGADLAVNYIDVTPTGNLVLALNGLGGSSSLNGIAVVEAPYPTLSESHYLIPSEQGNSVTEYSSSGLPLLQRDALTGGTLLTFDYAADGTLADLRDADGNVTTIERLADGTPTGILAPFGQATALTLDSTGYLASIEAPNGDLTQFTWSVDGLMQTMTDARGGLHQFTYDAMGHITADMSPDTFTTTFGASSADGLRDVTTESALGRSTSYEWTNLLTTGQSRSVAHNGYSSKLTLPGDGTRSIQFSDGMVHSVVFGPDPRFGMAAPIRTKVTDKTPAGLQKVVQRTLVASGANLTETINRNGASSTIVYDASARTQTMTSAEGRRAVVSLDVVGRVANISLGGFEGSSFIRDGFGRLQELRTGNRSMTFGYLSTGYGSGYLGTVTAPDGTLLTFSRDVFGRLLRSTAGGAESAFAWDGAGNLVGVTPPGKPLHQLGYTPGDLLESYAPPAAGLATPGTTYTYDADRMLRIESRPGGVQIVNAPDTMGRLSTVQIPQGTIQYAYYPPTATNGAGKTSDTLGPYGVNLHFTYDGMLTTSTTWSGDVTGSVVWTYNNDFNKILEVVNGAIGSARAAFGYDQDQLLACASPTTCNPAGADALKLTRDDAALVTNVTLGSTKEIITYNTFGELARQTATFSPTTPLVDITYDAPGFERDALSRIVRKTEVIGGATKVFAYTYNDLRRLTNVTVDGTLAEHFEYDANGNRTLGFNATLGTTYMGTYDDQDRLLSYGPFDFTYTANGELETKTNRDSGEQWLYVYDALGNLLSVGLPNGDVIDYVIDGMGRRVGKKKNGVLLKRWIYRDALKPVAELDGAGALVSEFVYGSKSNVPDYVRRGGATYRVISDRLGSPRYVVNVANASDVPFTANYTSFGEVTGTGLEWIPFGFAGGIYDGDTKVIRFGKRDFDPAIGRWISKEPLRFRAGRNFYIYAFNDPINLFDPTGLAPTGAGGASNGGGEGGWEGTSGTGQTSSYGYVPGSCGSGWNEPLVPDDMFGADWSEACDHHDACYGACGSDKAYCDATLDREISNTGCAWCGAVGSVYGEFVNDFGDSAYNDAQSESSCTCQ